MKAMRLKPPFSLLNDDLTTSPPKAMGLNPPLSLLNDDVSLSPPLAPFSNNRFPPRPGSRTPSFSSSTSSLSGSTSFFLDSHSDSPFHRLLPSAAVPFSWERQPGIPKLPAAASNDNKPHLLPLPPPLRSAIGFYRKKRSGARDVDPFAVALAQCAKDASPDSGEDLEGLWWRRSTVKSVGIWPRGTIAGRVGLVGFYGSCKTTCTVSDAIIVVPRAARTGAGSYGRMNRRCE